MSGPAIQPPPYLEEQDPAFAEGLKHLQWVKNADFGLLVLQGACPVCDDGDGIDIAVPTVIRPISRRPGGGCRIGDLLLQQEPWRPGREVGMRSLGVRHPQRR